MKSGLIIFLLIIGAIVLFTLNMNVAKVELKSGYLTFYNKKCKNLIPVRIVKKDKDLVDEISINRYFLSLENGDELVYEVIDLPPSKTFDKRYIEILEKLFSTKFKVKFYTDGFVLYGGEFDVALFYKAKNELILLYPANNLEDILVGCFKDNKVLKLPKNIKQKEFRLSDWNIGLVILDGIINKDI